MLFPWLQEPWHWRDNLPNPPPAPSLAAFLSGMVLRPPRSAWSITLAAYSWNCCSSSSTSSWFLWSSDSCFSFTSSSSCPRSFWSMKTYRFTDAHTFVMLLVGSFSDYSVCLILSVRHSVCSVGTTTHWIHTEYGFPRARSFTPACMSDKSKLQTDVWFSPIISEWGTFLFSLKRWRNQSTWFLSVLIKQCPEPTLHSVCFKNLDINLWIIRRFHANWFIIESVILYAPC